MRLPWRHIEEQAQREVEQAEQQLQAARAERADAEQHAARARHWLAENHISPKLQAIIREGR